MRTLFYVPIIHTSADLGSLAKDVAKRGRENLGEKFWREHEKTVLGFWDAIIEYFDSIEVSGVKIYQDGMVGEAEVGEKIVEEGVKSGSKNYELVSKLLKRGAVLVKTEDFNLVKKELDKLRKITQAKNLREKIIGFIKYKLTKDILLNKRDKFIAKRIAETLYSDEKGILFIGAYHNVNNKLPKDILIKEIKSIERVREYHKLLSFYNKNKERLERLSKYLISKVENVTAAIL